MSKAKYNKKQLGLLISIILIATVTVGGTLAWLIDHTDAVTNTFEPTEVTCVIDETMNMKANEKTDVKVTNTGDVDAYIRAKVVVTWQNNDGEVLSVLPKAGEDYEIIYTASDWDTAASDGYFYYTKAVHPDDDTSQLIQSCKPLKKAPSEGYSLHVELSLIHI